MKYAEVAPALPLTPGAPQSYTYALPTTGSWSVERYGHARIPFGKRQVNGVIIDIHNRRPAFPTKSLTVSSPLSLTEPQVAFAHWIASTMHGGIGYTLRLFWPRAVATAGRQDVPARPRLVPKRSVWARSSIKKIQNRPGLVIEKNSVERSRDIAALAARVLEAGRQVLIIVPETWMAASLVDALLPYLPAAAAYYHSEVSGRREGEVWCAVREKKISLIVGTQKALFLPWQDLGLIVVEEEYFTTHKLWDAYPRLHNGVGARALASIHNAALVFAGSIASLHAFYAVDNGLMTSLRHNPLPAKPRVLGATFADRQQHYMVPKDAIAELQKWLRERQRVFVLHNRRGMWSALVCRKCQSALRCPECSIALGVFGSGKRRRLQCRHCGWQASVPQKCPHCLSTHFVSFGPGTERIASIITAALPKLDVITVDRTTPTTDTVLQKKMSSPGRHIVLGTAAALRFLPSLDITRCLWLLPEQDMHFPDFRSEENALYTLTRLQHVVSPTAVVIATRQTRLIKEKLTVARTDRYLELLKERRQLHYPPYTDMVKLTFLSTSRSKALKKAALAREKIVAASNDTIYIRGPFHGLSPDREGGAAHLLLLGSLPTLTPVYASLPVDIVDVAPARVL